jgi:ribosome-associated protein
MPDRDRSPETQRMITPTSTETSTDARRRRARRQTLPQDDVPHTAGARSTPERVNRALELARVCARIADENRAKEIQLLDLRNATPLVDFFVIATAASRRQSHAIAEEIDQDMKKRRERKLGIEGSEEGRWVLLDYGDFVVHIFSPEARAYYHLEEIWGDAPQLDWQDPTLVRPASASPPEEPTPAAPDDDHDGKPPGHPS